MELHVSYCIYPKVQKENYVWGVEKGYCGNHQEIMRNEAGRTHRWESVQGSRPIEAMIKEVRVYRDDRYEIIWKFKNVFDEVACP